MAEETKMIQVAGGTYVVPASYELAGKNVAEIQREAARYEAVQASPMGEVISARTISGQEAFIPVTKEQTREQIEAGKVQTFTVQGMQKAKEIPPEVSKKQIEYYYVQQRDPVTGAMVQLRISTGLAEKMERFAKPGYEISQALQLGIEAYGKGGPDVMYTPEEIQREKEAQEWMKTHPISAALMPQKYITGKEETPSVEMLKTLAYGIPSWGIGMGYLGLKATKAAFTGDVVKGLEVSTEIAHGMKELAIALPIGLGKIITEPTKPHPEEVGLLGTALFWYYAKVPFMKMHTPVKILPKERIELPKEFPKISEVAKVSAISKSKSIVGRTMETIYKIPEKFLEKTSIAKPEAISPKIEYKVTYARGFEEVKVRPRLTGIEPIKSEMYAVHPIETFTRIEKKSPEMPKYDILSYGLRGAETERAGMAQVFFEIKTGKIGIKYRFAETSLFAKETAGRIGMRIKESPITMGKYRGVEVPEGKPIEMMTAGIQRVLAEQKGEASLINVFGRKDYPGRWFLHKAEVKRSFPIKPREEFKPLTFKPEPLEKGRIIEKPFEWMKEAQEPVGKTGRKAKAALVSKELKQIGIETLDIPIRTFKIREPKRVVYAEEQVPVVYPGQIKTMQPVAIQKAGLALRPMKRMIEKERLRQFERQPRQIKEELVPRQISGPKITAIEKPFQIIIPRQIQKQKQELKLRQDIKIKPIPEIGKPEKYGIFIPKMQFLEPKGKRLPGEYKARKREYGYAPSLAAQLLGIFGRKPKQEMFTGLEIRPVIRKRRRKR